MFIDVHVVLTIDISVVDIIVGVYITYAIVLLTIVGIGWRSNNSSGLY